MEQKQNRSSFSGKLGFVLSAAGASVGLGNIWRFPYLAAKYGGGIFLLIYIVLALTFGYTMIMAETALGRMTHKSPVSAYGTFAKPGKKNGFLGFGGWINAIIPVLIVPYYSVIGGWGIKYLFEYLGGKAPGLAADRLLPQLEIGVRTAEVLYLDTEHKAVLGLLAGHGKMHLFKITCGIHSGSPSCGQRGCCRRGTVLCWL